MGEGYSKLEVAWIDENIDNDENQSYLKELKSKYVCKGFNSLDEAFNCFYSISKEEKNNFRLIFVIVSGKFFGRYIKKLKENINEIINIPYTYIFTSNNYKKILLNLEPDINHKISYDTMKSVNDGFYNPGGVYDDFNELLINIKGKKNFQNINIQKRLTEKLNYEGVLTFEYLKSEEDLLALALYKDIITNDKTTKEDCKKFQNYIMTFDDENLNNIIRNLNVFDYIPFQILSKYWVRLYTIDSQFYKISNNDSTKPKLNSNYKTYIKMMYTGVSINFIKSYPGKFLYRGSTINKIEIDKIKQYNAKGKLSTVVVFSKAFLSFSEDKDEAKKFCGNTDKNKIGCLYILQNNNTNFKESNGDIQNFSVYKNEKEILFFFFFSFIITNIKDINNNKVEITLNYNGKFKEKYYYIYEDQVKINNLIKNNVFTKSIAGKQLIFLKGGRYLIEKIVKKGFFGNLYRAKDLESDEIVDIKEYNKQNKNIGQNKVKEYFENEVKNLFEMNGTINHSLKYREHFENKLNYYVVRDSYDYTLMELIEEYKLNNKEIEINFIKKIFQQLNIAFKELLKNHIVHRNIKPDNILIKYLDEEKINFDIFLGGYAKSFKYNGSNDIFNKTLLGTPAFIAPEILEKAEYQYNCDLFSIGITLYLLYYKKLDDLKLFIKKIKIIAIDLQLDDLIRKLLEKDPNKRITWREYFEHPFFEQYEY